MTVESVVFPPSYKKQLKSKKQSEKELQEEQRLLTLNVAICLPFLCIEKLFGQCYLVAARTLRPHTEYPYSLFRRLVLCGSL